MSYYDKVDFDLLSNFESFWIELDIESFSLDYFYISNRLISNHLKFADHFNKVESNLDQFNLLKSST